MQYNHARSKKGGRGKGEMKVVGGDRVGWATNLGKKWEEGVN